VTGITLETSDTQQDILNPEGINVLRRLPGRGFVLYGARTLSPSGFWRFVNTRVIFSIWGRTLQDALADYPFSLVDGRGVFFSQLKATATGIAEILRLGDALYGQTPDEAYRIVVDDTNNPPELLDAGQVQIACYGKPSPIAERINGGLFRVSLGTDWNLVTGAEEEDLDLAAPVA
jgi:phage tail sheath protein FI